MAYYVYSYSNTFFSSLGLAADDVVYLENGISLLYQAAGSYAPDFQSSAGASFQIYGTLMGYDDINANPSAAAGETTINIGSTGSVVALGPAPGHGGDTYAAIAVNGAYEIENAGSIVMNGEPEAPLLSAISVATQDSASKISNTGTITSSGDGIKFVGGSGYGSGEVTNLGAIVSEWDGIEFGANETAGVENDGTITGQYAAIRGFGGGSIYNKGTIQGGISMGAKAFLANSGDLVGPVIFGDSGYISNSGNILGDIDLGDSITLINSGSIEGLINATGGLFNDEAVIKGGLHINGSAVQPTDITVGANGEIGTLFATADAVLVRSGQYDITNAGVVHGLSLDHDDALSPAVDVAGGGALVNHGVIDSAQGATAAVYIGDATAANTDTIYNDGSILGGAAAGILQGGAQTLAITNAGSVQGGDGIGETNSASVVNSGTISGTADGVANLSFEGASDYLYNSGSITGAVIGVSDLGPHISRVVNAGHISGGAAAGDFAVASNGQERLVNSGTISGAVSLGASASTIVNSGAIDGNITFGGTSGRFVNSGSVDGNISFTGAGNRYLGQGGSFTGVLKGAGVDGRYYAGAGVESFDLSSAGAALAVGGTGETTFDYGATYNNSMAVQGGTGTTIVDLEGNYITNNVLNNAIFLGARAMVGVSKIVFGAGFSYSLSVNAATVVNGATMTVDASQVGAGQTALLNISKDVGGFYDFIGGAGDDTITCAANNLFANDVFLGGTSASNTINFKTAGTVLSPSFANVSGFSIINVASGANDIQLNDLMVTKANANHSVYLNLSTGVDTIDASLLITSTNNVTVNTTNASGGDTFIFGAARETVILPASASSSVNYDTIANFNFGTGTPFDSLYVAGYTANAIDASVSGSLSTASFDADLATALAGHLNNGDALLFTANAGTLAGDTFLIASTNHSAGYAAGDLVVRLTGTTTGTLATANV